jgi:hypothetical protein
MDENYGVPVEDAMARLDVIPDYDAGNGPEPCVHTFAQSQVGLLGAYWDLPSVEAFMRKHGVEKAGEQATAMNHGLVVVGGGRTIFFATAPPAPQERKP